MTRRNGARQYKRAGDDGDPCRHPDGEAELPEEAVDGFQHIAHAYGGDVGERGGDGGLDPGFKRRVGMDGRQMGLRRIFQQARGEHEQEVHAQRAPADIAQVGDLAGDIAPQNIDRDRIADIKPEAGGRIRRQGNELRARVIRRPPVAGDHGFTLRQCTRPGHTAVAAENPSAVLGNVFGSRGFAVEPGDAATQHWRAAHFSEPGDAGHGFFEGGDLIVLDVDKEIAGRAFGQAFCDLVAEIGFDQRHGHQYRQAEAERHKDAARRRAGPVQVGERQTQPGPADAAEQFCRARNQNARDAEQRHRDRRSYNEIHRDHATESGLNGEHCQGGEQNHGCHHERPARCTAEPRDRIAEQPGGGQVAGTRDRPYRERQRRQNAERGGEDQRLGIDPDPGDQRQRIAQQVRQRRRRKPTD